MRTFIAALVGVLAAQSPSVAQERDATRHLNGCDEVPEGDREWCDFNLTSFPVDYAKAFEGDYGAVRNVAFCLNDGCYGAIKIDREESCAWRYVAFSLAPTVADKDLETMSLRGDCTDLDRASLASELAMILQLAD